jgi:N-acetylneuraminic acid mutarotase
MLRFLALQLATILATALSSAGAAACALHGDNKAVWRDDDARLTKILTPLWAGPAFSGSWFTASRSGEGFILQVLDDGSALAVWFTYPPPGSAATQAWIFAQGGVIEGDRIRFTTVFTTRGPRFGAGFDPAQLQRLDWGTLEFRFQDCNRGEVTFAGPPAWGSGTRAIERLSTHVELECGGKRRVTGTGARTLEGLRQRSAAWFDPAHAGEGWLIEELPDGRAVVYWFTYDERGEQAWTVGIAERSGASIAIAENLRPVGTRFGTGFDAAAIRRERWGSISFDFSSCDGGSMSYDSTDAAFGRGTLRPVRLSRLASTVCIDGAARVATGGVWSRGNNMPVPAVSEIAATALDGRFYSAGGFGSPRAFRRYDPSTNTWTVLADLPGSRDHALATALAGFVYVTGGYVTNPGGDQSNSGWRYSIEQNRWEAVPQLPASTASGAAQLNGYLWFADLNDTLVQFDPRRNIARTIAGDGRAQRDHSQLVAFQGELWLIGGRTLGAGAANNTVSIFDPASETWRRGPPMREARSGFAAAVSSTAVFAAGGEVFGGSPRVLNSAEVYVTGEEFWSGLPNLLIPVHGVGGAFAADAFYVLGGSTLVGGARNGGEVQIYRY